MWFAVELIRCNDTAKWKEICLRFQSPSCFHSSRYKLSCQDRIAPFWCMVLFIQAETFSCAEELQALTENDNKFVCKSGWCFENIALQFLLIGFHVYSVPLTRFWTSLARKMKNIAKHLLDHHWNATDSQIACVDQRERKLLLTEEWNTTKHLSNSEQSQAQSIVLSTLSLDHNPKPRHIQTYQTFMDRCTLFHLHRSVAIERRSQKGNIRKYYLRKLADVGFCEKVDWSNTTLTISAHCIMHLLL